MKSKDVFTGMVLIVVGAAFLASNLGALPEVNFARLWPLILLFIGVGKLVSPGDEGRWSGASFILIAGIFLAHNYRVLELRDSWPLFIVIAGLSVLFSSKNCKPVGKAS